MDWFLYDNGLRHETVKKKFLSSLDLVAFFETLLPQVPVMFCETDPFI